MAKATAVSKDSSKKVSKKELKKQKKVEESESSSEASSAEESEPSSSDSGSDSGSDSESEDAASASDSESASDESEAESNKADSESDSSSESEAEDKESSESKESEESDKDTKRKADSSDIEMEDDTAKKQKTETYSLFVGNLAFTATDESLRAAFEEFSPVGARVATDGSRSRGFGYVDFSTEAAQESALQAEIEIDGRQVRLDKTTSRAGESSRNNKPQGEPSKVLFIGNLSFRSTEASVRDAFAECGTVVSVRIITDKESGRPKGYGYIEFDSVEGAASAMQWNNTDLDGRNIRLDYSAPRDNSRGGRDGGRGGFRGGSRGGSRGGFRGGFRGRNY
ncbi:hypothetical protein GGI25_004679 [Coemansia spiralis]|uniref:RRM domain-containing protein n=2 Tax=Coemansia TaxID=4863 RepID=A0A9W8KWY9_9FUNG|nr:hypothetical protein BX070DRAFT_226690 [Coemansia spiralis]KAJ1987990.1 hypothetical protein EDC05_005544 [Coemansia umbellata]KAJ2620557.1 hypothetical protein GGI26_004899 [Coemansia sp. RSA 1358]KAJ2673578.1 hypothetical protein GGI25_004679 [Coemansia spiralis]